MKTNNKCAAVRLEKSKLVAALAILAVAFVVIAAIPAVDVDATEPGTTETTKVAKVGDTQYGKIADAIAQADGKTVVLLTDVMESITIDTGKTVTLDLAGHKITNVETGKNTGTNANSTIVVKGTLTVIDSSESKSGEVVMTHEGNNGMAALYVTATGTVTINGGYFHNTYALSYYVVKNLGTVTINDGKFYNESVGKDGSDPSSVIANGYFWNKESNGVENPVAKMTITGGEFKGKAYVKNDYFGEMTITGGTFDVGEIRGAAIANQSKLTIGDGNGKVPSFTFNNAMGAVVLNYFWQDSDTPETADKNPVLTVNGLTTNGDAGALVGITSDSCPFGTVKVKDKNVWSGAIIDEKNTTFNGTVEIGNDKVQFTDVKAGVSGIIVKAGSVEITGTLDASTVAARIAAARGDVVLKDLTITGANGGSLTLTDEITVKGTLTVDAGARVIVDTGAELKIDGKVLVKEGSDTVSAATITGAGAVTIGQKGSIVVGGVVSTNGTFTNDGVISIINEKAQIPATISGNGSVDISAVASEGTISGDWNTVTTYTQNQTITLTGDTVLKEGSQIVIEGKLVIPEGITLTIEDGAQLVVFKSTGILENNGNIVVQSAAGAVYNSSTTWNQSNLVGKTAEKGGLVNIGAEIVNNGSIQLDFTFTDVSSSAYPENPQFYNSGKLTNKGEIVVGVESYFLINEEMTNAEGGIVTIDGQVSHTGGDDSKKIHNYGAIVFNGAVQTNNVLISMESADASVEVKAMKSGSGSQAGVIIQNGMEAPNGKSYNGEAKVQMTVQNKFTVSGLQVVAGIVKDDSDSTGKTFDRILDISGNVSYDAVEGATYTAAPIAITQSGNAVVSGELTLDAGVEMTVSGKLSVTGTVSAVYGEVKYTIKAGGIKLNDANASITVTGKLTVVGKDVEKTAGKINAAFYDTAKTYNYTTLDQAVATGAKKITVFGETKVAVDVNVLSGTTVTIDNGAILTIAKDSKTTFASGAILKNSATIEVEGTLYIEAVKTALKPEGTIHSEVVIKGENDRTYTTLANAIAITASGSTIELSNNVTLTSDLTIPEGIKVDTNGKTFTIPANYTLTVDGELFLNGSTSTVTMNLKDATKVEEDGKFIVNGTVSSTDDILVKVKLGTAAYTVPGAYYSITEGVNITYYVEPVAKAAAKIAQADGSKLEIRSQDADGIKIGDVSFSGTEEASAVVEIYTKLTVSSITLDRASVVFMADKEFNGSFTNGTGTVSAIGTAKNGFTVASSTSKDVKTLSVTGQFVDSGKDDKFAVSGEVTLKAANVSKVVVDGTAKVGKTSSSKVTTIGTLTVNGTVEVQNDAALNVTDDLEVLGAFSAAAMTNEKPAGSATAKNVFVGISKKNSIRTYPVTSGAAASVSGKVVADGYTVVADGSSVPETLTKDIDSTAYFIGDKAYVTVYAVSAVSATKIGVIKASVENANWTGWYADEKTKTDISDKKVGDAGYEKVYAIVDYNIYNVTVSIGAGIENVAIDGNLLTSYASDSNGYVMKGLKAGTHTVTYSLSNGYSGTATLTVNGEKQSGMTFSVSGKTTEYSLQLSGVTASGYTPAPTPAPSTGDDDGLSITDYLLIVLVILIVIMAVIVAMRLMRS